MSKYYWERGESAVAYIDTARRLSNRIKLSCANVNHKKFTFYGLQDLSRFSSDLLRMCSQINRLNMADLDEAKRRQMMTREARGLLDTIATLFGECAPIVHFSPGVLQEVSELIEKEDRLLIGLQKSDAERIRKMR